MSSGSEPERQRWYAAHDAVEAALEEEGTRAERWVFASVLLSEYLPPALIEGVYLRERPRIALKLERLAGSAVKAVKALSVALTAERDIQARYGAAQTLLRRDPLVNDLPELDGIIQYLEKLAAQAAVRPKPRSRRALDLRGVTVAKRVAEAYWDIFHRLPPRGRRGSKPGAFTRARRIKRDNTYHRLCNIIEELLASTGHQGFKMSDRARAAGIALMAARLRDSRKEFPPRREAKIPRAR